MGSDHEACEWGLQVQHPEVCDSLYLLPERWPHLIFSLNASQAPQHLRLKHLVSIL